MMKAITLHNPWAMCVPLDMKHFESRSWATSHRGEIALHAGKHCDEYHLGLFADLMAKADPTIFLKAFKFYGGKIVAVAELLPPISTNDEPFIRSLDPAEKIFGNYEPNRFAWPLVKVTRLPEPVPCRGFQQLWTVPTDIENKVRLQLHDAVSNDELNKIRKVPDDLPRLLRRIEMSGWKA